MVIASACNFAATNGSLTFGGDGGAANYLIFSDVSQANDGLLLLSYAGPVTLAPENQPGEIKPCPQSLSLERTARSSA